MGRKTDMCNLYDVMMEALQNAGYACEEGCGDCLFVDLNGATYAISATRCEDEVEETDGDADGGDENPAAAETDTPAEGETARYCVTWTETRHCAVELDATSRADAIEKVKADGCDPDQSEFDCPENFDAYAIDPDEAD